MIESSHYTTGFYSEFESGSHASAREIIPVVNDVFHPRSVADIGCGVGYWLKTWKEEYGIKDIQGIEGPYVSKESLKIPPVNVLFQDLKEPIQLARKFDLVMSLEVAEHLPESHAHHFIQNLTSLGDVILFSAAIEGQEGTYHINEQMPEYWSSIFSKYGFVPVDYIRPKIWNNKNIEWWYKQNILIYIKKEKLPEFPSLAESFKNTDPDYLLRIHPWIYRYKLEKLKKTSGFIGFLRWKLYPLKKKVRALIRK